MACRTPVLATRAGAAPQIVNGQNGVLVEGTVAAFVEQIKRFEAMPEAEWQTISDAAWQTTQDYSWKDATRQLLEHFRTE